MKTAHQETFQPIAAKAQRAAQSASIASGHGIYLGHRDGDWMFAPPQQSVLVLGPPRSGKTTSLIIPNLLAAPGPVVTTSTKPDVIVATRAARSRVGRCLVFDPTGTMDVSDGATSVRWSPVQSCHTWDGALGTARAMVAVGRASTSGSTGALRFDHWSERAEALIAPLLHAAALDGADLRTVLSWIDRRRALPAQQILAGAPGDSAPLAMDLLEGVTCTDDRELSGIWSTASGVVGGYRTEAAVAATTAPDFDPMAFVRSSDTLYICAPGRRQTLVAPMVVGIIEDIRTAAYEHHARTHVDEHQRPPVLLALDEAANIAPLPDLPAMVSEGGSQGLTTLACFQDLSQAKQRWGQAADGFLSLFGTTVVLPGIGDVTTLEALSVLAGDEEVGTHSLSSGRVPTGRPLSDALTGGAIRHTATSGTVRRRRLPADVITRGAADHALAFDERNRVGWVPLAPSHRSEPWLTIAGPTRHRALGRDVGR
ncbi:MAG: type secretion system protein VirD4 [Acidimicrobiaceae bacterium]|jgi:type IV secretory pathway TraG/TraD family ATPase VirD4|nr:type secretion system protein VirD4 [Acidimicrobiaceae bacterium]